MNSRSVSCTSNRKKVIFYLKEEQAMNQEKIGQFLRELRKEKGITQAQLAETLGVANRSVSRWENGVNMPDFSLLIAIAKFYDVEIGEILDGERKNEDMDKKTEETMEKIADYNENEKKLLARRVGHFQGVALVAMMLYMYMLFADIADNFMNGLISGLLLGIIIGTLILGVLNAYGVLEKLRPYKMRLIKSIFHK